MTNSIINICISRIEEKIKLDRSKPLSNSDYDYIAFLIEEKTKIRLGRSTIRRIWKHQYSRHPQISTLDALAQFLEYENWQSFKKSTVDEKSIKEKAPRQLSSLNKYILSGIILVVFLFIIMAKTWKEYEFTDISNNQNIKFECKQTGNIGLPKSVIFEYNIDSCAGDSFFIQQNWRKETKEQVYKNNYHHTDIYYVPGIHYAKLIANATVIKQIPVVVNSDNWMGMVLRGPYQQDFTMLTHDEIINNGYMTTANDTFTYLYVDGYDLCPLAFMNVMNFGVADMDNCQIETSLKAEQTNHSCNEVIFAYRSRNGQGSYVKLGLLGCISKLSCNFSDSFISGKTNDLTKLGCDLTRWVDIIIRVENKKVSVFYNQELVLETTYTKSMDDLRVLRYGFSGAGSIDYITIKSLDGEILYKDDFDDE